MESEILHFSDLLSHQNSGLKKGLVTRASEPSVSRHKEDGIMIRESNQWIIPVKEPQGEGTPYQDLR